MTKQIYPMTLKVSELKLADTVECFVGAYGTGTVCKVTETEVIIHRCYGAHAGFEYTGGLICYTGVELITYQRTSTATLRVWNREEIK